jgi:hypothetical protein
MVLKESIMMLYKEKIGFPGEEYPSKRVKYRIKREGIGL